MPVFGSNLGGESAPHALGTAPTALIGSLRSQHGFAIKTRKKYFLELAKDVVPSCVAFNHAGVGHCKLYKIPFIVLFDWKMQSGGYKYAQLISAKSERVVERSCQPAPHHYPYQR